MIHKQIEDISIMDSTHSIFFGICILAIKDKLLVYVAGPLKALLILKSNKFILTSMDDPPILETFDVLSIIAEFLKSVNLRENVLSNTPEFFPVSYKVKSIPSKKRSEYTKTVTVSI